MNKVIGRLNTEDKRVCIWGAGISGLLMGYYLKNQGYQITIYEKSNRVGGLIQTKKISQGLVEKAANALYLNADGLELLRELKLEPVLATKPLRRLLMINDRPKQPFQAKLMTRLLVKGHLKPPLITEGLTVAEFFKPLLGSENVSKYLTPVLGGIYATNAESLHFRSIFHQVGNKAQFDSYWDFIKLLYKNHKAQPKLEISGSVSFEGGMQTLINRLAEVLKHDIKLNHKEKFKLKGNTVICTNAQDAAELISELRPELSAELSRIKYAEICTSTVFMKREINALQKSFGVLIPDVSSYHSIGILNNKAIFPVNNENALAYTFISKKKLSTTEIAQDIKLLNNEIEPDAIEHAEITHWPKGLPIYDLQRYLSVKRLHQLMMNDSQLAFFGNYVGGISMREMISTIKEFSKNPT
ncbi:MAG: NAD(P)/FAD-dependent oxidoreductase [Bacteriovoracaceae bacterium]